MTNYYVTAIANSFIKLVKLLYVDLLTTVNGSLRLLLIIPLILKAALIPAGFPDVKEKLEDRKYQVLELDVSEFEKMDGGLTCLSLRF